MRAWIEGWARLAAAQADAGAALGSEARTDLLAQALSAQRGLWRAAAQAAAQGADSAVGAATLARYLDPGEWLFGAEDAPDPALRRLIDGPDPARPFGGAEPPEALALARALASHRALVAGAFQRMAERVARATAVDAPLTLATAQARWIEAARRELDALHASEKFLASQAAVIAAAVALREAEAAAATAWCVEHGLPTRAEVDALSKTVAALRRELRALRREHENP